MAQLINIATARGTYDNVDVDAVTELSVELSAIGITKTADKEVWIRGDLTYTIVVENIYSLDPEDPGSGLPVSISTVTDTIDPEIATLVPGSVYIDTVLAVEGADYTFDAETGLLTITSLTELAADATHTITFQVRRV